MEFLFQLLFKYRPIMYERGTLAFRPPWPPYVTWLLIAAAIGLAFFIYIKARGAVTAGRRYWLISLRVLVLLVFLLLATQPVLLVPSVVPQRSFVAIAYDTSRSMEIRDSSSGGSRLEAQKGLLQPGAGSWIEALQRKFKLRYFRFAASAERASGYEDVRPHGGQTNLENSLDRIAAEFGSAPVSGIVLLTDGADNRSTDLRALAARLRARRVPVYAVGIGSPDFAGDVELLQVAAPRRVLNDSAVEASVSVKATGRAGRKARLTVGEGSRQLLSRDVTLGDTGEVKSYRLIFPGGPPGPHVYRFRIDPLPDELLTENNEVSVLVAVDDVQPQVLYVEGEPRWIYGFLRRATSGDKSLHLVSLLRQADGKFLRQGVESSTTLEKGFPTEARELFRYKALILGSVEASFFTFDQLRLVSEFVSRRGGGFLMLGGRHSFSQGGYANTPIEDLLPVRVNPSSDTGGRDMAEIEFKPRLTSYGYEHPVTRVSIDDAENRKRWDGAPPLVGVNPTAGVKPGTTVLATAVTGEGGGAPPVLLAFQRFGRGRSMALATGSIWRWRMEKEHRDNFHDTFWRQMLRWLVTDAPDPVVVETGKHSYSLDESVAISMEVSEADFIRLNNARVTAEIKDPSGQTTALPVSWQAGKDGIYSASFRPRQEGIHQASVEAFDGERSVGRASCYFRIAESEEEFHDAGLNADLLRRISEETGGHYYLPGETAYLAEDISYVDNGASQTEEKAIWDMPFLFLLLIGSMCGEWFLRKKWGLS